MKTIDLILLLIVITIASCIIKEEQAKIENYITNSSETVDVIGDKIDRKTEIHHTIERIESDMNGQNLANNFFSQFSWVDEVQYCYFATEYLDDLYFNSF